MPLPVRLPRSVSYRSRPPVAGPQAQKGAEARLKELDLMLPPEIAPAANYVNYVSSGKLLFLSGNTGGPDWAGKGKLGRELTVEQGQQAARQAAIIMLSKIRSALGSLDRVKRIVKVLGMVNSADGFRRAALGHQRLFRPHGGSVRRCRRQARALGGGNGGATR